MSRFPILRTAGIWLPFSEVMFYPAIVALVFWTLLPIVKKSGYGFRTSKPTFTWCIRFPLAHPATRTGIRFAAILAGSAAVLPWRSCREHRP